MAADSDREHWSGTLGFVLAAVGSAVGLGNVWKFPYVAGNNGGGAFVMIYLGCIAAIGLPMLVTEMVIGRRSDKGPVGAYKDLLETDRDGIALVVVGIAIAAYGMYLLTIPTASNALVGLVALTLGVLLAALRWKFWGIFAIVTGFLLLSFYSVVGGWTVGYIGKAIVGQFGTTPAAEIPGLFENLSGNWAWATGYHAVFMAVTIGVVYGGVKKGIERTAKILMPIFGVLLFGMLVYALNTEGSNEALNFLFAVDFSAVTASTVLDAMGQAFFTLSLGMGAMIVYGSYLDDDDDIFSSAVYVASFDTLVALAAGVVIFGIVFSNSGVEPSAGPSLVFQTMPELLADIPGGYFLAIAFFVLLGFAALTSAMSLLEVVVSYFVDEVGLERDVATIVLGTAIFVAGIPSVLSFNIWADAKIALGGEERTIFGILDYLISNWALPIGGLGAALYAGWAIRPEQWFNEVIDSSLSERLEEASEVGELGRVAHEEAKAVVFRLIVFSWLWLIRIVAPLAILGVLYNSVR